MPQTTPYQLLCRKFSRLAGVFTFIVGILVLFAWQFDITFIKSLSPNLPSMNPLTALCFSLLGLSLLIRLESSNPLRFLIANICASIVLIVAVCRLLELLYGFHIDIDQILFTAKLGNSHIAFNTALNLLILSILQLSFTHSRNSIWHASILLPIFISLANILGYIYGVYDFRQNAGFTFMALHTSITFFILSCGMLTFKPDYGIMYFLSKDGISGTITRILLPLSCCVIASLGYLRLTSARLNLINVEMGILLYTLSLIVSFFIAIWYLAHVIEKIDLKAVEAEEKFRMLVEGVKNYAIFLLDNDGHIVTWNMGAQRFKGYEAKEIIGKHFSVFYPPEDVFMGKPVRELVIARQQGVYEEEGIRVRKDGSSFWAHVLITALKDKHGQLRGFSKITRDITEEKNNRERIQFLSAYQKVLVENAGNAIISTDTEGIIKVFNPAAERLLGYKASEVIEKQTPAIIHDPKEVEQRAKLFSAELNQDIKPGFDVFVVHSRCNLPNTYEWTYLRKDGSRVPVLLSVSALRDDKQHIYGYLGVASDVTELKKTQAELQQASKEALAAAEAKSNFLANMSHEIRTPMNAILGFSELLHQTPLDEKQQDYIKTIKSSGDLLINIINDILDFSKIEAGKIKIESVNFNLEYLISDVFRMIGSRLVNKNIHAFIDIDPKIYPFVVGDPTRLRQVLINLLGNAIKFTEQGEIGIIVRQDIEKSTEEEPVVHFIVRDTGIGVSPDRIEQIFQAFSQADDSTTRKFGGTGLGLTISKNLVVLMGGNMWVESIEGKGSEFIFNLKFKKGFPAAEQNVKPLSLGELNGKRVMIVDDNKHACEILNKYCQHIGFNVVHITTLPTEVLANLKRLAEKGELPEIILSDIMMPQLNGYALGQLIRKNSQYDQVKLIAVSSDIRIGITDELKEKGFNGFLPKPVTREEVAKVIATVLGDNRKQGAIVTRHMAEELSVKGIKVLLVEDVKANQDLMKAFFGVMGCVGDYAANGQEAIDKIKQHQYDICLMDVQMPVMGGIEATKIIRESINKDIPIIALTANVMAEDRAKCQEAGMNDFLAKPIDINKLKAMIKAHARLP